MAGSASSRCVMSSWNRTNALNSFEVLPHRNVRRRSRGLRGMRLGWLYAEGFALIGLRLYLRLGRFVRLGVVGFDGGDVIMTSSKVSRDVGAASEVILCSGFAGSIICSMGCTVRLFRVGKVFELSCRDDLVFKAEVLSRERCRESGV